MGLEIMKRALVVLAVVGAFASGHAAYAHHSFAATYLEDRTMEIEGKIVEVLIRNPHSFIRIEGPDEQGQMRNWSVEWRGAGQLRQQGVEREMLRLGDHVVATVNPARSAESYRGRMVRITRPSDGWVWGSP